MSDLKEFLRRANQANDMNPTDRKYLAAILEEFARRLDDLEKATDPHRMAEYD